MENNTQNTDAFYAKLKGELEKTTVFPADYLYKFILPTDEAKKQQLKQIFEKENASITEKMSSSGKFTSFSIRLKVKNADKVIEFYKEAGKIEGIVSL